MKPRSIASSALLMFVMAKGIQKGFILRRPCSKILDQGFACRVACWGANTQRASFGQTLLQRLLLEISNRQEAAEMWYLMQESWPHPGLHWHGIRFAAAGSSCSNRTANMKLQVCTLQVM